MTYQRWQKTVFETPTGDHTVPAAPELLRIAELQDENVRLRRLVTDLLLEKMRLEEMLVRRPRRQI